MREREEERGEYFYILFLQLLGGGYKEVEVCPDGLVIIEEISRRVKTNGGGALIADYGDMEIKDFTFRVTK